MNLVASGVAHEVLIAADLRLVVCPQVESEVLYLDDGVGGPRQIIDLRPLFDAGAAVRAELSALELERFIGFAAQVDDGEAQAIAVASARGVPVATDDGRAGRLVREVGMKAIDTPELMVAWAATVSSAVASAAYIAIERRAHFRPRLEHPLRAEWDRIRGGSGGTM